ncbi:serine/threonine-protein kinase [Streptomyces sp. NPDC091272]|uniref:serine/threonine-protein kinase n=1 Tax=Streptomyces sp. NPDC091272 TaxID=3365981 RepID=UPI0037F5A666
MSGRYRLLAPLGQGGMGVVWRARDEVLGREVAVKEVRAPAALGGTDRTRLYARLEREAWAAARISHRNVVTVYDVAAEDGRPWIVMELVRGLSLSDVLDAEGALSPRRAAHIGAEVVAALRAAHDAGVLHRDVKPGNVLIGNDGRVVLTDFGIAMVEGTSALTMTGELIGSPEFLAPERAMGRTPGPESDLWSLGVLLYAAVEGRSPFRLDTPLSTLRAVVDDELPPPVAAGPLRPVIKGLLRKDPARRTTGAQAEHQLRLVAAGGTAAGAAGGAVHGGPTVTTPAPGRPLPLPLPPSGTGSGGHGTVGAPTGGFGPTGPAATTAARPQPRRALAMVALGVAVLLLAVAGLVYALTRKDGSASGTGGGASPTGSNTAGADGGSVTGGGVPSPGGTKTGGDGGSSSPDDPGTPTGSSTGHGDGSGGATSKPPPQQVVQVKVQAVRASYTGKCAPPEAQAPAFTATITVGRTPADVEYRWRTESGESSDPGWKTLGFASGTTSRQILHTELTYKEGETWKDSLRVEVRSPRQVNSLSLSFSVTCEEEPPATTGGVTSPPVGTYGVRPPRS